MTSHALRRWRSRIALTIFLIAFTGCTSGPSNGAPATAQAQDSLARVRQSHELRVGYFLFEPTVMEDRSSGQLRGVFIDLIEAIGKSLNAKVSYNKVDLANFAAGLQSRQYDLSIGATFATPQRATAVAFTRPLFYAGYTGLVPKGQGAKYSRWQDLDRPDLKVSVLQGSAIDTFVRENFKHAQIVRLSGSDLTLPLTAVSSKQADVGLMNQLTVLTYLRQHPELEEILSKDPVTPTYFSWAVRPDDLVWLNFLNTAIDYYLNAGDFFRWESKYGIQLMHVEQRLVFPQMSYPEYWRLADKR